MTSVLVIDDEPAICNSIRQVLSREGFSVETADNGATGYESFVAHPADIVIVDIIMPRSDGIEVIRKIRAGNGAARIVAITGGGNFAPDGYKPDSIVSESVLLLARKSGADALLAKPFGREQLITTVRALAAPATTH